MPWKKEQIRPSSLSSSLGNNGVLLSARDIYVLGRIIVIEFDISTGRSRNRSCF